MVLPVKDAIAAEIVEERMWQSKAMRAGKAPERAPAEAAATQCGRGDF
jgi:hypothetical protein